MKLTKNAVRNAKVAGFTLIELLVVIAIIGILSSIVLASLSSARSKGNDSKVQEQVNSVKSAMEIYYSSNSSYSSSTAAAITLNASSTTGLTGAPFTDVTSGLISLAGASSTGAWPSGTSLKANITQYGTAYSFAASLSTNAAWCIDSTGVSKSEPSMATIGTNTYCP